MNKKRWLLASVVIFVVVMVLEYVFANFCMKNAYLATAYLWRPESDIMKLMPYAWAAYLVMSFLFVYIYSKGYEGKPSKIMEGMRFGLIVGFFTVIPMVVMCYVTMPITVRLSLDWFATGMAEFIIIGAVAGLIYKR